MQPSPATRPRPILKRVSAESTTVFPSSPKVHFPPSTSLTSTFATHSPTVYDRSPIQVIPNECELPERGYRTYEPDEDTDVDEGEEDISPAQRQLRKSSNRTHLHIRVACRESSRNSHSSSIDSRSSICSDSSDRLPRAPALVPDISSSDTSEESDHGYPYLNEVFTSMRITAQADVSSRQVKLSAKLDSTATQFSFLPYPRQNSPTSYTIGQAATTGKHDKRDSKSQSKLSVPSRSSRGRGSGSPSRQRHSSSFALRSEDEGCLGGF